MKINLWLVILLHFVPGRSRYGWIIDFLNDVDSIILIDISIYW
ncbi:hypothetical protein C1A50_0402 [Paenibacillus polymyxa]|nr:hypothetical protein C1A50_0402 [Paenibacillus polymyxa]